MLTEIPEEVLSYIESSKEQMMFTVTMTLRACMLKFLYKEKLEEIRCYPPVFYFINS